MAFPLQFFVGGAALGFTMGLTMILGSYDGLTSMIGAAIGGPIFAGIVMVLAFLLGLPLRLVRPLRHWWVTRGWAIAIACACIGLLGMVVAFMWPLGSNVYVDAEGAGMPGVEVREPNPVMYFVSIGLAALGLCHLMRPMKRVPIPAA